MCMLLVASAHFLTFWICTVINWHTLCVMAWGGSCRRHNIFAHACLQFCAHGCTWSNRSSSLQPTEAVLEASRSNELFLITCACKCPQAYVASLDMEHFFFFVVAMFGLTLRDTLRVVLMRSPTSERWKHWYFCVTNGMWEPLNPTLCISDSSQETF